MIKNMCIISAEYPSDKRMAYTFLEQLVNKFTDLGVNCYVIAPQSISRKILRGYKINKTKYIRYTDEEKEVKVYAPLYLTYSKKLAKYNLQSFKKSVGKQFALLSKNIKFDAIYAHFIFPSAIVANQIGKEYNIPVFFAYGENTTYTIDHLGKEKTSELLKGVSGVISVSEQNKKRLIDNKIVSSDLIEVFPNAINSNIFYKKDKKLMREKLGYDDNDFIVAFVGRFIPLKGIERLCDALNSIGNDNIKAIFIGGQGTCKPNYKNILYEGELEQKKIPDYLSASDIFVLPTTAEGCCNAIVEALACGLPVVSSNKEFNNDILDNTCSIRIDSMSVEEIKEAIIKLYSDKKMREDLSDGAVLKSKGLNLDNRAEKILNYIKKIIEELK